MLTWGRSRFQACEMSHAGPFFCLNMSFQEMVAADPKLSLGDVSNAISIYFPILCISSLFWILCFPIGFPMGSRWSPGYPGSNLRGCGWPRRRRTKCDPWPVAAHVVSICFNDHSRSHQQNIWKQTKKIRNGIHIGLFGRPNAGKSSGKSTYDPKTSIQKFSIPSSYRHHDRHCWCSDGFSMF